MYQDWHLLIKLCFSNTRRWDHICRPISGTTGKVSKTNLRKMDHRGWIQYMHKMTQRKLMGTWVWPGACCPGSASEKYLCPEMFCEKNLCPMNMNKTVHHSWCSSFNILRHWSGGLRVKLLLQSTNTFHLRLAQLQKQKCTLTQYTSTIEAWIWALISPGGSMEAVVFNRKRSKPVCKESLDILPWAKQTSIKTMHFAGDLQHFFFLRRYCGISRSFRAILRSFRTKKSCQNTVKTCQSKR